MTNLSPAAVAAYARQAGFTGAGLVMAVAVSLAEDPSGDPHATHTNGDGSVDRGLWMINNKWHPEVSDAQAFDPAKAATETFRISNGGRDWTPWATYKNGSAAAKLPTATKGVNDMTAVNSGGSSLPGGVIGAGIGTVVLGPVGTLLGAGIGSQPDSPVNPVTAGQQLAADAAAPATSVADAAKAAVGFLGRGSAWLGNAHNWLRVLEVVGGAVGVFIGLELLARSGVGGPVGAAAGAVSKVGSAAGKTAIKGAEVAAL